MRNRLLPLALAAMLIPCAAWGGVQSVPTDDYGKLAVESTSEFVGHYSLPTRSGQRVEHQRNVPIDGGTLAIVYGASGGDSEWHVVSYRWADNQAASSEGKDINGGPTDDPNPNRPTGNANVGDTQTNKFRIEDWEYTITYEFMVRDGAPGWHITSFSAVYESEVPPAPV